MLELISFFVNYGRYIFDPSRTMGRVRLEESSRLQTVQGRLAYKGQLCKFTDTQYLQSGSNGRNVDANVIFFMVGLWTLWKAWIVLLYWVGEVDDMLHNYFDGSWSYLVQTRESSFNKTRNVVEVVQLALHDDTLVGRHNYDCFLGLSTSDNKFWRSILRSSLGRIQINDRSHLSVIFYARWLVSQRYNFWEVTYLAKSDSYDYIRSCKFDLRRSYRQGSLPWYDLGLFPFDSFSYCWISNWNRSLVFDMLVNW